MYETDGRKEKLQYIQYGGKVLVPGTIPPPYHLGRRWSEYHH